jgi:hypothetical protein
MASVATVYPVSFQWAIRFRRASYARAEERFKRRVSPDTETGGPSRRDHSLQRVVTGGPDLAVGCAARCGPRHPALGQGGRVSLLGRPRARARARARIMRARKGAGARPTEMCREDTGESCPHTVSRDHIVRRDFSALTPARRCAPFVTPFRPPRRPRIGCGRLDLRNATRRRPRTGSTCSAVIFAYHTGSNPQRDPNPCLSLQWCCEPHGGKRSRRENSQRTPRPRRRRHRGTIRGARRAPRRGAHRCNPGRRSSRRPS